MSLQTRLENLEKSSNTESQQLINTDFTNIEFYCCKSQSRQDCCLTHLVGLPTHPATLQPMKLMPYQELFFKIIETTKNKKFHVNKSRQMGFTELILRILQYRAFNKYAGKKIIIVAGTREKTTKKIMQRFKNLFRPIPQVIKKNTDNLVIELTNGTVIEGLSANPESITGDTKIACVFIDESAKWNLNDDSVVMDAIKPIVETNKSDLFMISTPKGPTGFFYEIEIGENDFMKLKYNLFEAVGWIYTQDEADIMLEDPTVDAEQEYLNQYTTGLTAFFGKVPEANLEDDIQEVL